MKIIFRTLLLSLFLILNINADCKKKEKRVNFSTVNNNVCKTLSGDVVVYAIFVDSKYTNPWTEYDINSTLDSMRNAFDWVEQQAKLDTVNLNIKIDYHKTKSGMVPIKTDFSKKTLSATLYKKPLYSGVRDLYKWADKIAKVAGKSVPKDTSRMTNIKNTYDTRERLIAHLRNKHKTDKVALMYFVNNYYKDEVSVTLDINSDNNVEFSIVSFKNPSVIAHEFLHLFGAYDLYLTGFERKRRQIKKKEELMEMFPNEIMAFAHRDLQTLNISGFTKYLLGWEKELDPGYEKTILGKDYFAVKY